VTSLWLPAYPLRRFPNNSPSENTMTLESLSNDMFAPLSDKEASLVVGGMAEAQPIGYCYYATTIHWSDGSSSADELIVDIITIDV
jgi:hypothetical protein